jgi:hypothetical protein
MPRTNAKAKSKVPEAATERLAEDLAKAMVRSFGMTDEDAGAVAAIVVEQFTNRAEVNDETIAADLRSLFYTLEAKRIMSFRREEYDNDEGQKRRAFYWRLRAEVVEQMAAPEPTPTNEDVYHQLPAECWTRGARAEASS